MRVLVLSAHAVRLDRRISAQCNALSAAGHEVTLLSVPTVIGEGELDPSVRLIMPGQQATLSTARRAGSMLPAFLRPLRTVAEAFYGTGSARWCTRFFASHAPHGPFHAIHCHDLPTLPGALRLKQTRQPGAAVVYDAHEIYPHMTDNPLLIRYWRRIEAQACPKADAVLTINRSIAAHMAGAYAIPTPHVLHNSCSAALQAEDVTEQEVLEHFGCPPGSLRGFFQGSLGPGRNLRNLIRGFGLLARMENGPAASLCILGGGCLLPELRAICRDEGIANVFFGDWVSQSRLAGMLRHAHFGVIPYRGDASLNFLHCTPNKLYEYMDAGLPVCVNDLPELQRMVEHVGLGMAHPMRTPRQTAIALSGFLARMERGEFGGDPEAAREYGWATQERVLLSVYHRLEQAKTNRQRRLPGRRT